MLEERYDPAQALADVLGDICGPTKTLVFHPERGRMLRDGKAAGAWWLGAQAVPQARVEELVTRIASVHLPGIEVSRSFVAETLRRASLDPRLQADRTYRNRRAERAAERAARRRAQAEGALPDPDRPAATVSR